MPPKISARIDRIEEHLQNLTLTRVSDETELLVSRVKNLEEGRVEAFRHLDVEIELLKKRVRDLETANNKLHDSLQDWAGKYGRV
jgi:hypothetical protein